jgi:stearoyl-CoA desaturase (Delta-9 desaturase)
MGMPIDSDNGLPRNSSALPLKPVSEIDRYVNKVLRETKPLPPITWRNLHQEIRWFNFIVVVFVPFIALYGAMTTKLLFPTFVFATIYYVFSMFGTPP